MSLTETGLTAKGFIRRPDGSFSKPSRGVPDLPHLDETEQPMPAVQRERDLHDAIECYCRERGLLFIHPRMDRASTIQAGTPDFAIFMPGAKAVFLECKAKGGKTTTAQLAKIAHARKLGFTAEVVDSFADAQRLLE
jgi:ferredoxin-thioredoxin reductase catalytic subunit